MSADDGKVACFPNCLSKSEKRLITEYWTRKLLSSLISIDDMVKIIINFAEEFELFDRDLTHPELKVDTEYKTVSPSGQAEDLNAFGSSVAVKGRKYHWRLKIEKDSLGRDPMLNIGIVEADKAVVNGDGDGWWVEKYGYSYFQTGSIVSGNLDGYSAEYGKEQEAGDIIEIWLDLKDNANLSFGINGESYGEAFVVNEAKKYRFALNVDNGEVTILAFNVDK